MWKLLLGFFCVAIFTSAAETCNDGSCMARTAALLQTSHRGVPSFNNGAPHPPLLQPEESQDDAPLDDLTPCASGADFTPGSPQRRWCDFTAVKMPTHTQCQDASCQIYGEHGELCNCDANESACLAFGAEYKAQYCQDAVKNMAEEMQRELRDALSDDSAASCSVNLSAELFEMAEACCVSFPATACMPTMKFPTPCKNETDFLPDSLLEEELTCEVAVKELSMHDMQLLNEAIGNCSTLEPQLATYVEKAAKSCCSTYPATMCEPDNKPAHPCQKEGDFMPNQLMNEWCEFNGNFPAEDACISAGCEPYVDSNQTKCHCGSQETCEKLGKEFKQATCAQQGAYWPEYIALMKHAQKSGCDGLSTPWKQPLEEWIKFPASACCKSYPASVCDPDAVLGSPCDDPGHWMANSTLYEWCDLSSVNPTVDACQVAGCKMKDNASCWCEEPAACIALGGTFETRTCQQVREHDWSPDFHKRLELARVEGFCDAGVKEDVTLAARKCCSSYPATVCQQDVKFQTPCALESDFLPSNVFSAECTFAEMPTAEMCTNASCEFVKDDANVTSCRCDKEATCSNLGGAFKSTTCQKEVHDHWSLAHHVEVAVALVTGTCSGNLSKQLEVTAKTCCSSYPKYACNVPAEIDFETPCVDKADFLPDRVLNGTNGTRSTCSAEVYEHWSSDVHKMLKIARLQGKCPNDLVDTVTRAAETCCSSYPASICNKTARYVMPCADEAHFLPDNILHAECNFISQPNESECVQSGCATHEEENEMKCLCENAESCARLGGRFQSRSCSAEVYQNWSMDLHQQLFAASAEGQCSSNLTEVISLPAEKCCSSFPATICDKAAKYMTPCKDEADFKPMNAVHAWCESPANVTMWTCQAAGCHNFEVSNGSHQCWCEGEAGCAHIGGKMHHPNCAEEIKSWDLEKHKAVQQALERGSCSGVLLGGEPLDQHLWEAHSCCESRRSICELITTTTTTSLTTTKTTTTTTTREGTTTSTTITTTTIQNSTATTNTTILNSTAAKNTAFQNSTV